MTIKLFILFFSVWAVAKDVFLDYVSHRHDQKPLPKEVCDIYDSDRYRAYLQRKGDYRRLSIIESLLQLIVDACILFSPIYSKIEAVAEGNIYFIVILTVLLVGLARVVVGTPFSYYETFVIEEKYGLNKTTPKEFFKDTLIDEIIELASELFLYCVTVWICRGIGGKSLCDNVTEWNVSVVYNTVKR